VTTDKTFCDTYHANDQAYYNQLSYWTTPTKTCLDGRKDVECVDYEGWTSAWDEVKGS
jgi:putative spermidine/putrescine transport system substrate-binding protein